MPFPPGSAACVDQTFSCFGGGAGAGLEALSLLCVSGES